ncbi:MAG: hypothetical protein K0Q74_392 [Gammaproteobacteria bacterium]|nr:hypothetical protein [Gammaproteobacteria bacterium]
MADAATPLANAKFMRRWLKTTFLTWARDDIGLLGRLNLELILRPFSEHIKELIELGVRTKR